MDEFNLSSFRDALDMPGASMDAMCERIRTLRQSEMATTYLIERCKSEISSEDPINFDTLIRLLRDKHLNEHQAC